MIKLDRIRNRYCFEVVALGGALGFWPIMYGNHVISSAHNYNDIHVDRFASYVFGSIQKLYVNLEAPSTFSFAFFPIGTVSL